MITVLTGENSFDIERELKRIVDASDITAERIDGSDIELRQLPDLLMGGTLFASKRLVIIKHLSDNKSVWPAFSDWIGRVSDDTTLILVEPKPDKRTVTYKSLKDAAKLVDFPAWTDRDISKAEAWVSNEAKDMDILLDTKSIRMLVDRVGPNQWQLFHSLEKLSLVDAVTPQVIEALIDANPAENVFNLFDAALRGDTRKVHTMLRTLELTDDPYRLFALLSGQAFQLAAVVSSGANDTVAKDFGIHPYAVSKLESAGKKLGRAGIRKIIRAFASADDDIKLSRADPWLLIERALMSLA
jgi:DNA polymerase III delta subunit